MIYVQHGTHERKWGAHTSLGFEDKNGSSKLIQTTAPNDNQEKFKTKRACWIVNFFVPADHWVKLKESKKRDKYQNPARKLEKND